MAPIVPRHPRFNWIGCPPSSKLPISRSAAWNVQVTKSVGFIARHGLWTDEQRRQAAELERRIEKDNLHLVRLAWADPHGAARAKAVTPAVFINALTTGYNINVATTTLDSANARIFASFTRGSLCARGYFRFFFLHFFFLAAEAEPFFAFFFFLHFFFLGGGGGVFPLPPGAATGVTVIVRSS